MSAAFRPEVENFAFPRCVWTQHDAACGGGSLHYLATGVAADATEGIPGIFFLYRSQLNTTTKHQEIVGELGQAPPRLRKFTFCIYLGN